MGRARLLFYNSHIIAGGVVLGARKGEHTPRSTLFCLSIGEVVGISSVRIVLCCCHSSPSCSSGTRLGDTVKPPCPQDMVLTKAGPLCCGVKTPAETGAVPVPEAAVRDQVQLLNWQRGMAQTIWLSGVCPPLFSIVLGSGTGRTNQRKWPPSCLCPKGCMDVTDGEHLPSCLCLGSHGTKSRW